MFRRSRCNVHLCNSNMRIIHICLEDFVRASILDRRQKEEEEEKRIVFSTNGKPIFQWKEIRFQSLPARLFINFFHRVVSTSVRKLSRKSWFLEAAEYRFYNCFENFSNIFSFLHRSCLLSSSSRWVKSSPRRIPRKRINISKTCLHQFVEKL